MPFERGRFELVLDLLPEGCQVFDREGTCLYANETAARQAGVPREKLAGRTISEIYGGIEGTRLLDTLSRCIREGKAEHAEVEIAWSGSPAAWIDLSCSPVPEGLLVLTSDITSRRRVEESLKTSEARFRSLVEQAAEAMFVHDFDGRFLEVNQQACRSLGYTREELLGMSVTDVEQDFDLPAAQAQWHKIEKERSFTLYGHQKRKDGTVFPVEVRFGRFDVGSERYFLGLVRDITERKEAELKRKHLTDVLRAIRNVNQLIVQEKDPAALLRRACDLLTETRGYDSAWIASRDAEGRLRAAAESGIHDADTFRRAQGQIEEGAWPRCCRQALEHPGVVVVHDVSRDCAGCPLARVHGAAGALAVALRSSGRDYGVLVAALPPEMAGDAEEQSLFGEVASDIGFALRAIETEKEKHQAAEDLARSEKRLKAAMNSMTDTVVLTDTKGNITDFNDTYRRFGRFGGSKDTATSFSAYSDALEISSTQGQPIRKDQWSVFRALKGETIVNEEHAIHRKDTGETLVASMSFAPIRDDAGAVIGSVIVGRDITEQKRSEEALRESEARFAKVFRANPVGINMFSLSDIRCRDVNDAFLRMIGYAREEVVGHTADELDLLDKESRDAWARLLQSGVPILNQDMRIRRKSGETRHVLASIEIIEINGERLALVIAADITDRDKAEEALRESESRFRALIEGAPDGIYVQREGRFLFLNSTMARLIGAHTQEELLGTEIIQRIAPEHREAVNARLALLGRSEGALPPMELEYLRLDSGRIPVETTSVVFPFQGRDANVVFVRDITARRKAEQEQASLQAQLLQAQKMESVGRLAGGVAHDFNNILTVQRGYCQILKYGLREDDPLAIGLAQIDECAEQAASLTRQLLAFSRKQAMQPRVLDMNTLATNLDRMLRRLIGEDVELSILASPTPAMVKADPGQIEQVIVNLAVNARDAMPEGGALTVQVTEVELDETYSGTRVDIVPGPYVMLSMSDTGTGMDEETKRHIFEPFFTTKGEGKGTGLGLSTVYGIVRQSSGTIWVYSEPGRGTTFKVYLPRVHGEASQLAPDEAAIERGRGELVLVVEDEQPLRELAKMIVDTLGYKATTAANGGEALILVEEEGLRPDLVLTDVVMPGMSGRVLVERLRRTIPDVKVIYMSGYTDDAVVRHGVLESEITFLQKPFTTNALAAKLRSTLRKG
jgi:two-component system, cell cycle sensor histidine kinase and response regulator CckA